MDAMDVINTSNSYIIQDKTIIFTPEYNLPFDTKVLQILSNLDTIIFDCGYRSESKPEFGSEFNQSINNLPNSIRRIT